MLLHELCHALHWRLFQQIDQNINAAYTEAVKSCLYENVVYWPDKTIR